MKYLLLGFRDDHRWNALPATQRADFATARRHFDDELRAAGNVLAECALAADADPFHLRESASRQGVTGTSLRELVVIEARDLNEAIRVAFNHPAATIGEHLGWSVEIRPLDSFTTAPNQHSG